MPTPWSRTVTATARWSAATVTSTLLPSAYSIALTSRLRRMRSTRRGSMSAVQRVSGSDTCTHEPFFAASGIACSTAFWTTSRTS